MNSREKIIKNIIVFLLLIMITFMVIFKNYNFKETIDLIFNVDYKYILIALGVMFLDYCFEAMNINMVLSALEKKVPFFRSLKHTLIGRFFSGITPAATGGQPMEIYYMKKDGIPVSKSTLALLTQLCAFHIVSLIIGVTGAIVNHKLFTNGFIWIFAIGISLNLIATSVLLIGLFSRKMSKFLVNLYLKILRKFRHKNISETEEKLTDVLNDYQEGAKFIKKHKAIFIKSMVIVFFQILMYYSVAYCVYRSFGLNSYSYFRLISISAMLYIAVSSMPLPGTVGISESAFLKIYLSIYGIKRLAGAMLLNRGINFYFYMIIDFLVVTYSTLMIKNNKS